jgi:hypothetical protein
LLVAGCWLLVAGCWLLAAIRPIRLIRPIGPINSIAAGFVCFMHHWIDFLTGRTHQCRKR